jgi:pullulanase/glycogen debranching enzyme
MQNKPNFQKDQMNVNTYNTTDYENKFNWTLGENKPNQSQFQTGRPLIDRRKYK